MTRIAYYRVSTRDQSIDAQRAALGGGFAKEFSDEGVSGATLAAERPGFAQLLAYVREGGVAPIIKRIRASHLDLLRRQKAEREGQGITRTFATRWPTGRLEVHFPNGTSTPDLAKAMPAKAIWQAAQRMPELWEALVWAG